MVFTKFGKISTIILTSSHISLFTCLSFKDFNYTHIGLFESIPLKLCSFFPHNFTLVLFWMAFTSTESTRVLNIFFCTVSSAVNSRHLIKFFIFIFKNVMEV